MFFSGAVAGSFLWHFIKRSAVVLFWAGALWFVYLTIFKPHINPVATESQKAERIVNNNYTLSPKQTFFGCADFRISNPGELSKSKQVDKGVSNNSHESSVSQKGGEI